MIAVGLVSIGTKIVSKEASAFNHTTEDSNSSKRNLSDSAGHSSRATSTTPSVPTNISVALGTGTTTRSLDISWRLPSNASGVELTAVSSEGRVFTTQIASPANSYNYPVLDTNHSYAITMRTYRIIGTKKVYSGWVSGGVIFVPNAGKTVHALEEYGNVSILYDSKNAPVLPLKGIYNHDLPDSVECKMASMLI